MYSLDFREQVLSLCKKENLSIREGAKRFGIASRTLVNWKKRINPIIKRTKKATKLDEEALKRDVIDHPDAYQYERAQRLKVSETCIWKALRRINVTYKKNANALQSGSRKACHLLPKA